MFGACARSHALTAPHALYPPGFESNAVSRAFDRLTRFESLLDVYATFCSLSSPSLPRPRVFGSNSTSCRELALNQGLTERLTAAPFLILRPVPSSQRPVEAAPVSVGSNSSLQV